MDKLEKQLNVEEFNEEIAMVAFKVFKNHQMDFVKKAITESGLYKRNMQTQKGMVNLIVKKSSGTTSEKQTGSS
ncbi:hypothetical protein Tco_0284013 [Tanacetum coccineum]